MANTEANLQRTERVNNANACVFRNVVRMKDVLELRKARREAMKRAQQHVLEAHSEVGHHYKAEMSWHNAQAEFDYYTALGIRLQELGYTADGEVIPEEA